MRQKGMTYEREGSEGIQKVNLKNEDVTGSKDLLRSQRKLLICNKNVDPNVLIVESFENHKHLERGASNTLINVEVRSKKQGSNISTVQ
jgi:hypothetical protein